MIETRLASAGAYVALAIVLVALPLVGASHSGCRFVGSATQDYEGRIDEPGHTAGLLAFTAAPALAGAALVLLVRGGRRGRRSSRLALSAAVAVFPLALAVFLLWTAKSALACGLPTM